MLRVTILCGNPKKGSRTLRIAEALVSHLVAPGEADVTTVDLAEYSQHIFEWPSDVMAQINQAAADSDLLVVASPTYKASYTGLLKGFLDRYPAEGLAGVVAIPVMTGADLGHAMGPEVNLRPLLVELGASVPTKGFYFVMSEMDQLEARVQNWVAANAALLRSVSNVAANTRELAAAEVTAR
ncbi:NAD(P)H-dependent oxidoreductase [Salinibacterium sp. dk2585]|uniref:NADPH-dependent FMN reductase n=1 Tax=unclassified Salinibacterium TaxID=2632331 RepID=UPI0011C24F12|nr:MULTISPECIES: NAD(P)H-dependent oxidoreductase [unclassified Salinibacterium]QEE62063.1 NAD(P)H-dependent oxidoreductase [Salinibacterium sp. dk2585]TXK53415.1 NAD(P)H-dependent oxidoreductase [Salinibacterium sp. dk5596]